MVKTRRMNATNVASCRSHCWLDLVCCYGYVLTKHHEQDILMLYDLVESVVLPMLLSIAAVLWGVGGAYAGYLLWRKREKLEKRGEDSGITQK